MCTSDLRYACPWKMASQQTMQIDSLKTSVESLKTCWVSPESLNPIPGRCPISEVRMAPFGLQLLLSHLRWQNVTLLRHECLDKRPVCRYACPTDAAIRPRDSKTTLDLPHFEESRSPPPNPTQLVFSSASRRVLKEKRFSHFQRKSQLARAALQGSCDPWWQHRRCWMRWHLDGGFCPRGFWCSNLITF